MGIRPPKMKWPHWKEKGLAKRLQQDNHKAHHPLTLLELPKPWSLSLLVLNLTFKTMANMQGVVARLERTNSCANGANSSSAWMSWAPHICTCLQENGCSRPHSTVLDLLEFQLPVPCPFARNLLSLYNSLLSLPCNYIKFLRTTIDCGRQVLHNCKKSKNLHKLNGFALQDASSWFADRQRAWELK